VTQKPVFISARFRSGSTLLWNMFRHMPGCLAYYEPLHEHLPIHIEANAPASESHINVSSYWDEYHPIAKDIETFHSQEFGLTQPYMDKNSSYPELAAYIRVLLKAAGRKTPVLQFNRVDFRLAWLKETFPEAVILHLERDPRENWFSMGRELAEGAWKDPLANTQYDLVLWSLALHNDLPFLFSAPVATAYHRHYILWRLSGLLGRQHADLTLHFEKNVLLDTEGTLNKISALTGIDKIYPATIISLVSPPPQGRWRQLAAPEWFDEAEAECESLLNELGLLESFGNRPLEEVRQKKHPVWSPLLQESSKTAIKAAIRVTRETRNVQHQIWQKNHELSLIHHKYFDKSSVVIEDHRATIRTLKEQLAAQQQQCKQLVLENKRIETVLGDMQTENRIGRASLAQAQRLLASCEAKLQKQR